MAAKLAETWMYMTATCDLFEESTLKVKKSWSDCDQAIYIPFYKIVIMRQSMWIPGWGEGGMDNPGDSDSFLTSHSGDYDNGVHIQGQFWHLK